MFTWINKCGAQSSSGFIVEHVGLRSMLYREDGKSLELYAESYFSSGELNTDIWQSEINKWKNGTIINDIDQARIIENIRAALRFMDTELTVNAS